VVRTANRTAASASFCSVSVRISVRTLSPAVTPRGSCFARRGRRDAETQGRRVNAEAAETQRRRDAESTQRPQRRRDAESTQRPRRRRDAEPGDFFGLRPRKFSPRSPLSLCVSALKPRTVRVRPAYGLRVRPAYGLRVRPAYGPRVRPACEPRVRPAYEPRTVCVRPRSTAQEPHNGFASGEPKRTTPRGVTAGRLS
jgi:hypothetical protein